ncbi:hypothetical protein QTN25_009743 [Entamoeba marina]
MMRPCPPPNFFTIPDSHSFNRTLTDTDIHLIKMMVRDELKSFAYYFQKQVTKFSQDESSTNVPMEEIIVDDPKVSDKDIDVVVDVNIDTNEDVKVEKTHRKYVEESKDAEFEKFLKKTKVIELKALSKEEKAKSFDSMNNERTEKKRKQLKNAKPRNPRKSLRDQMK